MENSRPSSSSNICKFLILETHQQRRLLQPRLLDNLDELRHKKPVSIKRCLFGKSDPEDTKQMLEEQYWLDQERFMSKFGFDIEAIESLERDVDGAKENMDTESSKENCGLWGKRWDNRKVLKARRKVVFNKTNTKQSQQFITDFYQARKSLGTLNEKTGQTNQTDPAQERC